MKHCKVPRSLSTTSDTQRSALSLHPPSSPDRPLSLSNLATALTYRYNQSGKKQDLEDSISLLREALSLRPPGHPNRSSSLNNLASALMARHTQLGRMEDLEDMTSFLRDALSLCPPGHPERSSSLMNLASALMTRYHQLGQMENLEDSIAFLRDALRLCPLAILITLHRSTTSPTLSVCVMISWAKWRTSKTLFYFIERRSVSILLAIQIVLHHSLTSPTPSYFAIIGLVNWRTWKTQFHSSPGHPDRFSSLNHLVRALMARYNELVKIEDLQETIVFLCHILILCPPGHRDYPGSLSNLAHALKNRYDHLGQMEDLENSTLFLRNVLRFTTSNQPDRFTLFNNLANMLITRYNQLGEMADLEDSILSYCDALIVSPPGHHIHCRLLNNLASDRFRQSKKMDDFQEIFRLIEQATNDITSHLPQRLVAGIRWATFAREFSHESVFSAFTIVFTLVNRSLISRPSVESQQQYLANPIIPRSLASDAASDAIAAGKIELAVEFLEQGRAILWSKVDAYRYPLEHLRQVKAGAQCSDPVFVMEL